MKAPAVLSIILIGTLLLITASFCSEEEEVSTASITGVVLMPDGTPAEGATVNAMVDWPPFPIHATTVTDADGRFELNPPHSHYKLWAGKDEYVYADIPDLIDVSQEGLAAGPIEMRLVRGCVVRGKLIDRTTGEPVSEAEIVISSYGGRTETAEDGTFEIATLKADRHILAIKEDMFWPEVRINAVRRDEIELTIETAPGGTIRGIARDVDGDLIPNLRVLPRGRDLHHYMAMTNEDGEYTISGFDPAEEAWIGFYVHGDWRPTMFTVSFPEGELEAKLDFQIEREKTRNISGRVTTADGSPVERASVVYGMGLYWREHKQAISDSDGRYSLDAAGERNLLVVRAEGFAPVFTTVDEAEIDTYTEVDFVLEEPGHWVEIVVEDEDGNPLEGVLIAVYAPTDAFDALGYMGMRAYGPIAHRLPTDGEGRVRAENLPSGLVQVEAYTEKEYTRISSLPVYVDRENILVMYPPGYVAGTVLNAQDDTPVTQFRVFSSQYETRGREYDSPDGTFKMSRPLDAPAFVSVQAVGYLRETVGHVEPARESELDAAMLTVRLKPSPVFEGVITDGETGQPLEGVTVTAIDPAVQHMGALFGASSFEMLEGVSDDTSARTDAEGRFRIESVQSLNGLVTLEKQGYGRRVLGYQRFTRPLETSMLPGATIRGIMTDEHGEVLTDARIRIRDMDGDTDYGVISIHDEGRFEATDLPAGQYQVIALVDDMPTMVCHVTLGAGEEQDIDWQQNVAEIEGVITLAGDPVPDARILLLYAENGRHAAAMASVSEDGSFRVPVFETGMYRVLYGKVGFANYETIDVQPGKNHLDLSLPAASISGQVVDESTGEAIGHANIRCYVKQTHSEAGRRQSWWNQRTEPHWIARHPRQSADEEGRFEIVNLPAGEYLLAVQMDGTHIPGRGVITLGEDESVEDVVVEIPAVGSVHIGIADSKDEETNELTVVRCVDQRGFVFSALYDVSASQRMERMQLMKTPEGRMVFPNLPAGKYQLYVRSQTHRFNPVEFEVTVDEVTVVDIKPDAGERIIFRLVEDPDDPIPGGFVLGYRLSTPDGEKHVLVDEEGPYWGDLGGFLGEQVREAGISVQPGTYLLRAGIMYEDSENYLWEIERIVEVVPGQDIVIEITEDELRR